jgi:hypothetical protein
VRTEQQYHDPRRMMILIAGKIFFRDSASRCLCTHKKQIGYKKERG